VKRTIGIQTKGKQWSQVIVNQAITNQRPKQLFCKFAADFTVNFVARFHRIFPSQAAEPGGLGVSPKSG
jgi:hypothetical protein